MVKNQIEMSENQACMEMEPGVWRMGKIYVDHSVELIPLRTVSHR